MGMVFKLYYSNVHCVCHGHSIFLITLCLRDQHALFIGGD